MLIQVTVNKIRVVQIAMERSVLGLSLRDCVPNIRERTKDKDAIEGIASLKLNWDDDIVRRSNEMNC